MTALLLAAIGAYGVFLLVTSLGFGWTGLRVGPERARFDRIPILARVERWMRQAGLAGIRPGEFIAATIVVATVGAAVGAAVFGSVIPTLGIAVFAATTPVASYRHRRAERLAAAHDAWPHMIDEIRVLTGAAGRSIPQAFLDVGLRGPDEMHAAFSAASREWLLTTDFERTVAVVREHLADPTADTACETLLIAHLVGGSDLDRRLAELAEDRRVDQLGRKDARSKQAGVRFARRFVIAVPVGMAVAGISLGDGRAAYQSGVGQVLVAVGLVLVAICWVWSGRMLRLPEQMRVSS